MNDPRGPGAQPRTRVTAITVASEDDGSLNVIIELVRRIGTFPAEPNVTDLPDDARAALVEWISGPPITAHPDRIARPAGHG